MEILFLLEFFKENILSTFPEDTASDFAQMFATIDDGEKVVTCQLSDFAGKTGTSIGKEDLRLAIATGIEQYLAGGGMAGMVLEEADAEIAISKRDPACLTAPSSVN